MEDKNNSQQENVRVDLYKVRQKVFSLYKLGSEGHKEFIRSLKEAELGVAEKSVQPELVDFLEDAAKVVMRNEVKEILKWAIPGVIVSLGHLLVSTIIEHSLLVAIAAFFCYHTARHLQHLFQHAMDLNKVRKNYQEYKKHLEKLTNDLKKLEGPGDDQ